MNLNMRKIFPAAAAVLFVFCAAAELRAATLKKITQKTASHYTGEDSPSVAVLNFAYEGGRVNSGTEIVRNELIKHFSDIDNIRVIDKELCDMIIIRFMLHDAGIIGRITAVEIGKLLDADILVTGKLKDSGTAKTLVRAVVIDALRAEVIDEVEVKIQKVWSDEPSSASDDENDYTDSHIPLDFIEIIADYDEVTREQPLELIMNPGDSITLIAVPNIDGADKNDISKMIIGFAPRWSALSGSFVPYNSGTNVKYVYSGEQPAEFYIKTKQMNNKGNIIEGKIKVVVPEDKNK